MADGDSVLDSELSDLRSSRRATLERFRECASAGANLTSALDWNRGGGFEKVSFGLDVRGLVSASNRKELNSFVASVYPLPHRPDAEDIVAIEIGEREKNLVLVTVIVKRGHFALTSIYLEGHEVLNITKEGCITCSCHPGIQRWVMNKALPAYAERLI